MYSVVLRSCPTQAVDQAVSVVSAAFAVKETTAKAVLESVPIIIVDDCPPDDAATLCLLLRPLEALGIDIEIVEGTDPELPKIDWPKRPKLFRRSFEEWHYDLQLAVPLGDGRQATLLELLRGKVTGVGPASSAALNPQTGPMHATGSLTRNDPGTSLGSKQEFTGSELGEITPFSNPVLPAIDPGTSTTHTSAGGAGSGSFDELFHGDEPAVMPSSNDIDSAFAQLMGGDEEGFAALANPPSGPQPMLAGSLLNGAKEAGTGGFSVFLAKIADPNRQKKAVPLLAEYAGISADEAATLAKKMIIPVLKGVSKDEAEAVKHRFAEIGVLARIKEG